MLKIISVRDEYIYTNDENILHLILEKLQEDFLFMPLENFEIEVHEEDIESIRHRLVEIKKELIEEDIHS